MVCENCALCTEERKDTLMKKAISVFLIMSVVLCLFASCGSSENFTGRWAADNLGISGKYTKGIIFFDMNLLDDGTGDYTDGTHYDDGSGITGTTRPLTWTSEKNIITCTLETKNGNEVLKFEFIKNNPDQGNVDTLKFLDGDYKDKFLTPAESGTDHEDIFDLPEKTTKDHSEEPESISIDNLLQMSYDEYKDRDFYFYIKVNEVTPYMVKADVYGNSDFSGTYFKETGIPLGSLKNVLGSAAVGSKYMISASVIHCSKDGISLSAFDAAPID